MKIKTYEFECQAVVGHGRYKNAWESRFDLDFRGCVEEIEGIDIGCTTARYGQLIEPKLILLRNAFLPAKYGAVENEPGIFGNFSTTFTCGDMLPFRVEGLVNGTIKRANCDISARQYALHTAIYAHGGYDRARQSAERFYDLSFNDNAARVSVPKTRVGIWQIVFERNATVAC